MDCYRAPSNINHYWALWVAKDHYVPPWTIIDQYGLLWTAMNQGLLWTTLVYYGPPQTTLTMGNYRLWNTMGRRPPWTAMGHCGSSWTSLFMDYNHHGLLWTTTIPYYRPPWTAMGHYGPLVTIPLWTTINYNLWTAMEHSGSQQTTHDHGPLWTTMDW